MTDEELHVVDPLEEQARRFDRKLAAAEQRAAQRLRLVLMVFGVVVAVFGAGFTFTFAVSHSASTKAKNTANDAKRAAAEAERATKAIAALTITIQDERARNTRDACEGRNAANRRAKKRLEKASAEVRLIASGLVDDLSTVDDCDAYVAEKIGPRTP